MKTASHFTYSLIAALLLLLAPGCKKTKPAPYVPPVVPPLPVSTTFKNPLMASGADPWVYEKDGYYYYMQTMYTELRIWKTAKMGNLPGAIGTIVWTPTANGQASGNLWAPELYFLDGKWYIYYSAGPAGTNLGLQRTWDPLESTCRHASLSIL